MASSPQGVRGMDFPRMQLAAVAAFLILLQLISLDLSEGQTLAIVGATTLCLVWQLWWILPYTKLWGVEVQACKNVDVDRQISILTANVLSPNCDAHKLVALVNKHKPDVLVTLESDQWWESQLASLEADMPETMKCPPDNLYGMHVYLCLSLHEKEISFLVEDEIPSMHALLELPTGDRVRVHFLHPAPPSPTENPESAERTIRFFAGRLTTCFTATISRLIPFGDYRQLVQTTFHCLRGWPSLPYKAQAKMV